MRMMVNDKTFTCNACGREKRSRNSAGIPQYSIIFSLDGKFKEILCRECWLRRKGRL